MGCIEAERKEGYVVSKEELVAVSIDRCANCQRIKKTNGGHENTELDYSLKIAIAKLSSPDVNVEDLTLV